MRRAALRGGRRHHQPLAPRRPGHVGGAGGPLTSGAVNCIAVFLRMRTDEIAHLNVARTKAFRLGTELRGCRRRQRLPHGLQLRDRTNLSPSRFRRSDRFTKDSPNQRQILGRDLFRSRGACERRRRISKRHAALGPLCGFKIVGIVGWLGVIEVDYALDGELVAIRLAQHGAGRENKSVRRRAMRLATSRVASRYLLNKAGYIVSDSPLLSNPD